MQAVTMQQQWQQMQERVKALEGEVAKLKRLLLAVSLLAVGPFLIAAKRALAAIGQNRSQKMKKISALLLTVGVLFLLSGCADHESQDYESQLESRIEDIESQLDSIQSEFDDVRSAFNDVKSSLESLKSEVDDFRYGYENWQDNVSDVEDAVSSLESEISDLESEINDVELELPRVLVW